MLIDLHVYPTSLKTVILYKWITAKPNFTISFGLMLEALNQNTISSIKNIDYSTKIRESKSNSQNSLVYVTLQQSKKIYVNVKKNSS